jgi:hypothetical protein
MAYIGNIPAESFISFEKQVFTIVNSQTAYTLSHSVVNENDIRLVVNNVVQEPGSGKAYTASGTTLTLSAALVNGTDTMYCVFLGRAIQTVNPPNASVGSAQVADSLISGKTALGATPADTDELLISDAGTLKRVDYSYLKAANTPAFQATLSSDQTVNQNTSTIVAFDTEDFDTGSAYDTSTYKFTPQTAGKYFCYSVLHLGMANDKQFFWNTTFWKNGAQSNGSLISQVGDKESFDYYTVVNHDVITFNGSSDYIQLRTIFYDYTSGGNYNLRGNNSDGRKFNMFGAYKLIGV